MVAETVAVEKPPAPASDAYFCKVGTSRESLASCTEFFQKLAPDEHGGDVNAELAQLALALAPTAREVLPAVIECLGASASEVESAREERWAALLQRCGVLHIFAVAHLLGASDLLNAARDWVAARDERLEVAISDLDTEVDGGSFRIALDFGLDQRCVKRSLIHVVAAVDAAPAMKIVLERRGDVLLDPETLVDLRDSCGRTPLHTCALHDSVDAASALIEASADLEALCANDIEEIASEDEAMDQRTAAISDNLNLYTSSQSRILTPLHIAAAHDRKRMAELLLDARANVAACLRGVEGAQTPLHEAAEANAGNVARVLALAAAAAAVDLSSLMQCDDSKDELAPREHELEQKDTCNRLKSEDQDLVRWSRFLDPLNAKCGHHGSTPLHVAAEHDASSVVRALMEAKADPCLSDDQGDTPLHCALLYGAPGALSELLAHGAPIMTENSSGELALHMCAEFGLGDESETESAVLSDVMLKRHFNKSDRARELLIAALREKGQLASALAHKAAGLDGGTPLHSVALKNHLGAAHAVRDLVEARADLESRDDSGRTPYMIACRRYGKAGKAAMELKRLGAREIFETTAECAMDTSDNPNRSPASLISGHEDAFAKALGGSIRPIQVPGGLNIMELVLPQALESEGAKIQVKEELNCERDASKDDLQGLKVQVKEEAKDENNTLKAEGKEELKDEVKDESEDEKVSFLAPKDEVKEETKDELKDELNDEHEGLITPKLELCQA
mmetsp:Transcript_109735/g.171664  ORF Transcript_109735/g.171664 Transcript_109735/m.171664 type:complete len:741 (+) Transcript_109735:39-2261(+)